MSVVTQDFVAAGKPFYIVANSGVTYTDITDGIIYRQTTIPYGKNWKIISNNNVYTPNSGVTAVTTTTPLQSTGGTAPTISILQAGASSSGYLSAADWNTFSAGSSGGVPSTRTIATTAPLQGGGDLSADRTLSIPQASNAINGYLSSGDWTTFNNKGNGTVTAVTGTSPIVSSGGNTPIISIPQAGALTDGFLSSTDWGVFNGRFPYPTGTISQYIRGDGSLATFPTIPTVTPAALTKTDDTNVTLALTGTPTTALLQAVNVAVGWTGTLADTRIASASTWNSKVSSVTGTSPIISSGGTTPDISIPPADALTDGYLSQTDWINFNGKGYGTVTAVTATSLLTSSGGTTPDISSQVAKNRLVGRNDVTAGVMEEISIGSGLSLSGTTLSASGVTGAALTKTDDTNVTLTLGGTPTTALLAATSLTLGWSGTLADSRISSASVWNAKQNALAGSGLVKSTAGTISYVSGTASQFVKGDGSLDSNTYLTSAVTSVGATSPITSSGGATPSISTSMATNKLIGRGTAGTGVMEEITVGSGLSLSGTTLSNTATPTPTGYYLSISDSTTQTNPTANTPRAVKFDSTDLANGFSLQTQTAVFTGTINNGGAGAGTILNVTGVTSGTLKVGMVLTGGSITAGTFISAFTSGTGGIGTYVVSVSQNRASATYTGTMTSQIVCANTGIYNLQFSSQMDKSDAGVDNVNFWLRKNGVDIPYSAGNLSLQGASPAYMMPAWNYVLSLVAGDIIELYWGSADENMSIYSEVAQTSPFAHPAIQSTILTITQQSGIMAGTGITAINSLTGASQTIVAGTSGTDFAVSSVGTAHTLNLPTACATNRGALSSTDWSTFNSKGSGTVTGVTGTAPVVSSGGTAPAISMAAATTSVNGYLTSTDWTTFNGKQTSPWAYRQSGRWYTPSNNALSIGSLLNSTTRIVFQAVIIDRDITVTQLGIAVVTIGLVGTTCRVGIYSNDPTTTKPLTRLVDSGTLALDSTGTKSVTGLSIVLTKGLYWFAYTSDASTGTIAAVANLNMPDVIGAPASLQLGLITGYAQNGFAYAALPASVGTLSNLLSQANSYCIFYQF